VQRSIFTRHKIIKINSLGFLITTPVINHNKIPWAHWTSTGKLENAISLAISHEKL